MSGSAFDEVVESVRAALNAKRGEAASRVASVEAALRGYERALEAEIAEAFAAEHGLKLPARGELALEAARKLAKAVAALPELSSSSGATSAAAKKKPEPEVAPELAS